MLGFRASEVLGQNCFNVFQGSDSNGCLTCRQECDAVLLAANEEPIRNRDFLTHTKCGSSIWLNIITLRVPSHWQKLTLLMYVMRDITRQKVIESNLQQLFIKVLGTSRVETARFEDLPSPCGHLTAREREVLQLLAAGLPTQKLASTLYISEATVRNHIHQIISKLGVHNRLEAVVLAHKHQLL